MSKNDEIHLRHMDQASAQALKKLTEGWTQKFNQMIIDDRELIQTIDDIEVSIVMTALLRIITHAHCAQIKREVLEAQPVQVKDALLDMLNVICSEYLGIGVKPNENH